MSESGYSRTIRRAKLSIAKRWREITASRRVLPDYVIIGAQRCGTTSLHNYLMQHPNVVPSYKKEIKFFDSNYSRGERWYRSHFPYEDEMTDEQLITGEGSPYYIFHPKAAQRMFAMLPNIKLIALLRNPVDRAYSHYQLSFRRGRETLSFEDALGQEEQRLDGVLENIIANDNYPMFNHKHFTYRLRGIYADQLPAWFEHFSREQILVIKSEDFYADSAGTFQKVISFLELPAWDLPVYKNYNAGQYSTMQPETRAQLVEYFKPHNQRLYELLGTDFGWA
jgi:hypothetical protein